MDAWRSGREGGREGGIRWADNFETRHRDRVWLRRGEGLLQGLIIRLDCKYIDFY